MYKLIDLSRFVTVRPMCPNPITGTAFSTRRKCTRQSRANERSDIGGRCFGTGLLLASEAGANAHYRRQRAPPFRNLVPPKLGGPRCRGSLLACIGVQPSKLVRVDRTHQPRGEYPLEETAEAARALPLGPDRDFRCSARRWVDNEGSDRAGVGVGFNEATSGFGLCCCHAEVPGPSAGRKPERSDGPCAHAARYDLEV